MIATSLLVKEIAIISGIAFASFGGEKAFEHYDRSDLAKVVRVSGEWGALLYVVVKVSLYGAAVVTIFGL